MTTETIEKLDQLMDGFDQAMLVTRALDGGLRARPMAIAGHEPGGALFFATRGDAGKISEILKQPDVAVTMQDSNAYLSVSGVAALETETRRLGDKWSASMRVWFPDGPEDEKLVLIRVDPAIAEYWDMSGTKRLEFLWKAGKALARGERLEDEELSGHRKINLG